MNSSYVDLKNTFKIIEFESPLAAGQAYAIQNTARGLRLVNPDIPPDDLTYYPFRADDEATRDNLAYLVRAEQAPTQEERDEALKSATLLRPTGPLLRYVPIPGFMLYAIAPHGDTSISINLHPSGA